MNYPYPPAPTRKARQPLILEQYLNEPAAHADKIFATSEDFILVRNPYGEGKVHFLVIPKKIEDARLHSSLLFSDPAIKAKVKESIREFEPFIAEECRRVWPNAPKGKNWMNEMLIGCPVRSSMQNSFVHIVSKDLSNSNAPCYHFTLTTDFFIPLEKFPLKDVTPELIQKFRDNLEKDGPGALPPQEEYPHLYAGDQMDSEKPFICQMCGLHWDFKDWNGFLAHKKEETDRYMQQDPGTSFCVLAGGIVGATILTSLLFFLN